MQVIKQIILSILRGASFISMVSTFLRIGSGLITLPLALRAIPSEQLGLYYTFMSITGLAMLVDFGFAQSVGRNAAYAMGGATSFTSRGVPPVSSLGEPNWQLLGVLKDAVQKWYLLISIVLGIILLTLGSWFIKNRIEESGLPSNLILCWIVYCITSSYGLANLFWGSLLIGIGSVRAAAKIGLVSQCIGIAFTISGLTMGLGIWTYALLGVITTLLGRILSEKALRRDSHLPSVKATQSQITTIFSALWPMAWRQGVVMIGAFFIQKGNTIICSSKLGLEETSKYGLSLYILNIVLQVAIIPLSLSWPLIGKLRVNNDIKQIRSIFFSRLYIGIIFAILGVMIAVFVLPPVLNLLGSQTSLLPTSLFCILGIILMLETHHSAYASLVISENENPFMIPAILSGIGILIASWWAADRWGIWGLIFAQGIVQLLWNNWWTVSRGLNGINLNRQNPSNYNTKS